jgi:GNAT superfamily N-acetyltransferase
VTTAVGVTVRRAVEGDLDAVLAVGHRTWPPTYEPLAGADYVAMGLAKWWSAEATRPLIDAGRVTVAEVDGEVVGVAAAGPLDGRLVLWKLYVLPGHQGEGIGAALLDAVVDEARGRYAQLRLAYLDGNERAGRFYSRHGFVEVERETGSGGLPDSVWMERQLEGTE